MKCQKSKAFFISLVVLFFLFSVSLSADWCYTDEQKAELDQTFSQLSTTIDEQQTKISEQAKQLTIAQNSIKALQTTINEQKTSLEEAKKSWQRESTLIAIRSGLIGAGITAVIFVLVDAITGAIQ